MGFSFTDSTTTVGQLQTFLSVTFWILSDSSDERIDFRISDSDNGSDWTPKWRDTEVCLKPIQQQQKLRN